MEILKITDGNLFIINMINSILLLLSAIESRIRYTHQTSLIFIQILFLPPFLGYKWVELREKKRETIKHTIQSNFHGNVMFYKLINVLK